MDDLKDIEVLERLEENRRKLKLPEGIKPCMAELAGGSRPGILKEGINAFILATELVRVGKTEEFIEMVLDRASVKLSKMRSAIKSASTGKYQYGCPSLEAKGLCLFKNRQECRYWIAIPKRKKKVREMDYFNYGWPLRLTPGQQLVYFSLKTIERRRKMYPGTKLFVSFREISKTSGISGGHIASCFRKLAKEGLIDFQKGKPQKWLKQASEVKRIIPIPRPR